jgi:hypothetical protein
MADGGQVRRVENLTQHDLARAQIRQEHLLMGDRLPERKPVLGPAGRAASRVRSRTDHVDRAAPGEGPGTSRAGSAGGEPAGAGVDQRADASAHGRTACGARSCWPR